jgi:hypothetical protein
MVVGKELRTRLIYRKINGGDYLKEMPGVSHGGSGIRRALEPYSPSLTSR